MKPSRFLGSLVVCSALAAGLILKIGCGGGFLGLEDYQRDLLGFGLTALLSNQDPAPADAAGDGAGQPVPGPQGETGTAGADGADGSDGISCWDLNQNGQADLDSEDANGDGVIDVADCLGADGASGEDAIGAAGSGADGISCWDLNGNGVADVATEDTNGDGTVDVLDCQGADGADGADGSGGAGSPGADGATGADGPQFFSTFIDDFFALIPTLVGDLTVDVVNITEPVLGRFHPPTGFTGDIAYRVAIPDTYGAGNDVTMRLFFLRSETPNQDCFVLSVARALLRDGQAPVEYPQDDIRQVSIDSALELTPASKSAVTQAAVDLFGNGSADKFLVIDLPLNVALPGGLGYWDGDPAPDGPLASGDLLAFELHTDMEGGAEYLLLGVEFFESQDPPAAADPSVALIFAAGETVTCAGNVSCGDYVDQFTCGDAVRLDCLCSAEGVGQECLADCNQDQIPDGCQVCTEDQVESAERGDLECYDDCDGNGVLDVCEDCNENGTPDQCDLDCGSEACGECPNQPTFGSLEACAGNFGGTYTGETPGEVQGTMSQDGSLTLTFVSELGPVLFEGIGLVSGDGSVFGGTKGAEFSGTFDFATCTAQGGWFLGFTNDNTNSSAGGGPSGSWSIQRDLVCDTDHPCFDR